MPTKAAVREMLPPKRVTWASRYSRSNTSRASRSGRRMISLPLSHLTHGRARSAVISCGSMSARIGSRGVARRHDQQPVDDVAQLAHVAGPGIGLQRRHRVLAELARRRCRAASARARHEMAGQQRDVLAPLAQRRHPDRHDVEPVEQILAEPAGRDLGRQVAVRRRR